MFYTALVNGIFSPLTASNWLWQEHKKVTDYSILLRRLASFLTPPPFYLSSHSFPEAEFGRTLHWPSPAREGERVILHRRYCAKAQVSCRSSRGFGDSVHPQSGLLPTFLLLVPISQEGLWKQRFRESALGAPCHPDWELCCAVWPRVSRQPSLGLSAGHSRIGLLGEQQQPGHHMLGEEIVKRKGTTARLLGRVSLGLSPDHSWEVPRQTAYSQPVTPRSLMKMKLWEREGLGGRDLIYPPAPTSSPLASFPQRILLWVPPPPTPPPHLLLPPLRISHWDRGQRSLPPGCVWWASSKLHDWLSADTGWLGAQYVNSLSWQGLCWGRKAGSQVCFLALMGGSDSRLEVAQKHRYLLQVLSPPWKLLTL